MGLYGHSLSQAKGFSESGMASAWVRLLFGVLEPLLEP